MVHTCGSEDNLWQLFPPSTMWILGTVFRLSLKLGDKHDFSPKLTHMCGMGFTCALNQPPTLEKQKDRTGTLLGQKLNCVSGSPHSTL